MASVRKAGWEVDDETGTRVFRVVVDFEGEHDLPDFPIAAVWKKTPVKIVLVEPQK